MTLVRCLRSYKRLPIKDMPDFASAVEDGIYDNPTVFAAPPLLQADFQALIDAYVAKRGTYVAGGTAQKPAWEAARTALIDGLDTTADYVDTLVNGNENIVILAGYKPTKTVISSVTKPTKIQGVSLTRNDVSGVLIADCKAQDGINSYVCILTEGAPLPDNITISNTGQIRVQELLAGSGSDAGSTSGITAVYADFNQSRKKEFEGLTPLQTYYCVFFGINAGGVGALSDPVSIICL